MARILAAWEYGEGLGHLGGLIELARALREHGHEITFALRDATRLAVARDAGFESWPAPLLRVPAAVDPAPVSHGAILLSVGFADAPSLSGTQRAWDGLLRASRAQAIIADYAPGALLAAARGSLPRATFGSGFALPASSNPFPALRPWESHDADSLRALDDRLRSVLQESCGPNAPNPAALLEGSINLVSTWPELDPLGPRDAQYGGPVSATAEGVHVGWRETAGPRVIAYLRAGHPAFSPIVEALRASGAEVVVAAPGLESHTASALSRDALRVVPSAVALRALLPEATLCVCHGGAGLTSQCMKAGVPLALLPLHLEQSLVARRLQALGAATIGTDEHGVQGLEQWLRMALSDDELRQRARAFARAHADAPDGARLAAERIHAWLA